MGKLFLATQDPQQLHAYALRTQLKGNTKNSLSEFAQLEQDLVRVRERGVARDNEELELGVKCMACGIYDDQGQLVAGLSISAPADRLDETWLAQLQETARQISHALGHRET